MCIFVDNMMTLSLCEAGTFMLNYDNVFEYFRASDELI